MKVLHVYKSYYPDTVGGIEQVIAQLGLALSGLGVENRIYTLSPQPVPAVLARPEGEVHRSRLTAEIASNTLSLAALSEFRAQVDWADVIHYQFPWPFGDVLHLLRGTRKPSVVSYQSDIVRQKLLLRAYAPVMNRFLGAVDAVVATSPQYRDSSEVLSRLAEVRVIPNGIDEASYPQPSPALVERWRGEVGEGFMLFVGVLRYYKGLHTLLEAARGFAGRVVIAGDGPEAGALRAAAAGLDNVRLLGRIGDEDKMALLQLSRAFVFPSHLRSEAFGMSLVEAAMQGRPMVSCEIGTGTTFINEDGVTGRVIRPENPAVLREAMEGLLQDPAQAQRLGKGARARYEALFTADAMARSYLALYRELAARR